MISTHTTMFENPNSPEVKRIKSLEEMRVYTLSEIGPVLGCTRPTLMHYIKSGRLKAVKIGGKWKVSQNNLRRFIDGV